MLEHPPRWEAHVWYALHATRRQVLNTRLIWRRDVFPRVVFDVALIHTGNSCQWMVKVFLLHEGADIEPQYETEHERETMTPTISRLAFPPAPSAPVLLERAGIHL